MIAHGLRRWFDKHGQLKGGGQRVTRHHYDLDRLMGADLGPTAAANLALGADCVAHARMFFNSPELDLASAAPGAFALTPTPEMRAALAQDYQAMLTIFGDPPSFDDIMASMADLKTRLNAAA